MKNRSDSRLGAKLLEARREAGLSQGQLAAMAGCNTRTVWQAECGQGRLDHFLRLAELTGREIAGRSLPAGGCIGSRLLALRQRIGMSRRALAAASTTSASTLAAIESGQGSHVACVERVAKAMGAGLTLVPVGAAGFYAHAAMSSAWDAWASPQGVLDRLYIVIGGNFDLDPCSPGPDRSRVDAKTHFDAYEDGLSRPWIGKTYMNPPYCRKIGKWVCKARGEVEAGRAAVVIGLVPARTDTKWWHSDIAGHADVWLLQGRLSFGDGSNPAPFASALVLWGATHQHKIQMAREFPDAWQPALPQAYPAASKAAIA